MLVFFWAGSCGETAELLSAHVEQDVPLTKRGRVRRHLARCAACRAVLRSLRRVLEELRSLRPERAAAAGSVEHAVLLRIGRDELRAR